jgi:membrane fusion protein, multidrug efflux system
MIPKMIISLGAVLLVVLTLGATKIAQIKEASSQQHLTPPSAVTSFEARLETWTPTLGAIATFSPVQGVVVSADTSGSISSIVVENGASVQAGALLLEIDSSVERAQLAAAEARLVVAKLNADRAAELIAKNTISQAELDTNFAQFKQVEAEREAARALLAKKAVRAPFAGRVGIRHVNVGQYVSPGMALLPLQQLDPIYVNFNLPQRQLPQVAIGQAVEISVDAFTEPVLGKVNAIDSEVNSLSRNVTVQALVANPGGKLRAGMFGRIELQLPAGAAAVVIPTTAVAYAPYGNSIFVLEQIKGLDGQEYLGASQRFVKLGVKRGDLVEVTDGLRAGEVVASAGVFKLRNGAPVLINNTVQPSDNSAPKPANI